jgi:hypothetical protein
MRPHVDICHIQAWTSGNPCIMPMIVVGAVARWHRDESARLLIGVGFEAVGEGTVKAST